MDPVLLVILLAGGGALLVRHKQQTDADASASAADPGTADDDRDAALHDEIIPALGQFVPGLEVVADLVGEDVVEDVSDFLARVDDLNRQNLQNLSDDIHEAGENIGDALAAFDDSVRDVTTKIFSPVTRVFDRWF